MAKAQASLDLGNLPDLLGYNIRRAQVVLWRDFLTSVDAGAGIRPGVFTLLLLVSRNPGAAQIELARARSSSSPDACGRAAPSAARVAAPTCRRSWTGTWTARSASTS